MRSFIRIFGIGLLVLLVTCAPVMGGSESAGTEKNTDVLKALINDLERAIEDADQRMVAHPSFLTELRALVERYQAKIRQVFFSDDFSDGDYTRSPQWQVRSGDFTITPERRLRSRVFEKEAPAETTTRESGDAAEEVVKLILRDILAPQSKSQTPEQSASKPPIVVYEEEAAIETEVPFAAAFEVDFSLVAQPSHGAMEIVLIGGKPAQPLYRLVYHAAPSQDRPIQIIREKGGRSYIIEAAAEYPMLEDGAMHRVQWVRDVYGKMSVIVDGKTVIRTAEIFYRDPFSGLALVNRGGAYEWDSIRILQPQQAQAE